MYEYEIVNPVHNEALVEAVLENHPDKRWVADVQAVAEDGTVLSTCVSLFWEAEPHPGGSNYAIFHTVAPLPGEDGRQVRVANGASTAAAPLTGLVVDDGGAKKVIFSQHRHHFHQVGDAFIDGGRDYVRTNVFDRDRFVRLVVREDRLVVDGTVGDGTDVLPVDPIET